MKRTLIAYKNRCWWFYDLV